MSDSPWYYTDANGQQQGPFPVEQIKQFVSNGIITHQTLLWQEGLENWVPANEVSGIFATPAPPPAPVVSTNTFSSPGQTPFGVAPTGGEFPIPSVKKSSFALYLGSHLLGFALIIIALVFLAFYFQSVTEETPYREDDLSHIEDAGVAADPDSGEEINNPEAPAPREFDIFSGDSTKGFITLTLFILSWISLTIGGIYGYIILYRAWYVIQPGGAQSTPGKAIGFLFIPFFNLYWTFIAYNGWANDWTRIRSSYSNRMSAPAGSTGTFLTGCILMLVFPLVGIFFFFAMISQMCAVSNYMASTHSLSKTQSTGLTGTKFY